MDFLKKIRKRLKKTTAELSKESQVPQPTLSKIENDKEYLGEERAKLIGEALGVSEEVMTVYRGRLPEYAKKVYKESPDKLEKSIRKAVKKLEESE